jgi:SSS family solute:Na+ symporter
VIALATLIEPAFFQRCYAAKNENVARWGIVISIGCWAVFDFLTTTCGLYARAILPDLADPVASYPALAIKILPAGLLGFFAVALLATIMSTIDSYAFLAATTFGHDIVPHLKVLCRVSRSQEVNLEPDRPGSLRAPDVQRASSGAKPWSPVIWTRFGLVISVTFAVVLAMFFQSVVDIWHAFGSIGTPALLVPLFTSFVGSRRLPPVAAVWSIVTSGGLSLAWYVSQYVTSEGGYWLGIEPIFPGLVLSLVIFGIASRPKGTTDAACNSRN